MAVYAVHVVLGITIFRPQASTFHSSDLPEEGLKNPFDFRQNLYFLQHGILRTLFGILLNSMIMVF